MKTVLYILAVLPYLCFSQDTLDIQYSIVGMSFYQKYDIIKIKVPPWLKSSELIKQIKRCVIPPESNPPHKITYIYVFKETDQIGATSKTGAIYIPSEGFRWDLNEWKPISFPNTNPSDMDFEIYYDLVDTIIREGLTLTNLHSRQEVAKKYLITLAQLDSIYSFVKFWLKNN